jgi:SPASM domain peptide maturase of grasp-with-spasm system
MQTMQSNDTYLKLFANCVLTEGKNRSTLLDLQRSKYYVIPNSFYDFVIESENKTINQIKDSYDIEDHEVIDDYLNFLLKGEFVFFTSHPENYPKLNYYWQEPSFITNAILDIGTSIGHVMPFIEQLKTLFCKTIQVRIFEKISNDTLYEVLEMVYSGAFESIELYITFNKKQDTSFLNELCQYFKTISMVVTFDSPQNEYFHFQANNFGHLFYTSEKISDCKSCGKIDATQFVINIKLFMESQFHNTCLNRKISIDQEGNLKNCPSMITNFGHIDDVKLKQVINNADFTKYWNISKDQISVCKDCEFRYICTDCRAYIENPEDMYSKPLKCGYNPYTAEWEEWSTNPLKQQAKEYYGMT